MCNFKSKGVCVNAFTILSQTDKPTTFLSFSNQAAKIQKIAKTIRKNMEKYFKS